jgi:hypothetical protein
MQRCPSLAVFCLLREVEHGPLTVATRQKSAISSHSQIHARIRRLAAATFAEDLLEEDAKDLLLQSLAVAFSTNLL